MQRFHPLSGKTFVTPVATVNCRLLILLQGLHWLLWALALLTKGVFVTDVLKTTVIPTADTYEQNVWDELQAWETKKPTSLQQLGDRVGQGVSKVLGPIGKVIPKSMQEQATKSVETVLNSMGDLMGKTVNASGLQGQVEAALLDCSGELEARDRVAMKSLRLHVAAAGAEGTALGFGGLATIAADIPVFMGIALRSIYDISSAYGYPVDNESEQRFVMMTLAAVSASGMSEKRNTLFTIGLVGKELRTGTWKSIDKLIAASLAGPLIESISVKELAKKLGLNLTKRKAAQLIPIAGAVVGGSMNAIMLNEIAHTAYMVYRRRWLADKGSVPRITAQAESTMTLDHG